LNGQNYHGSNEHGPDAADFRMYSELTRIEQIPVMKGLLGAREKDCLFIEWYKLMSRDCKLPLRY
jgi:hypothetical protein